MRPRVRERATTIWMQLKGGVNRRGASCGVAGPQALSIHTSPLSRARRSRFLYRRRRLTNQTLRRSAERPLRLASASFSIAVGYGLPRWLRKNASRGVVSPPCDFTPFRRPAGLEPETCADEADLGLAPETFRLAVTCLFSARPPARGADDLGSATTVREDDATQTRLPPPRLASDSGAMVMAGLGLRRPSPVAGRATRVIHRPMGMRGRAARDPSQRLPNGHGRTSHAGVSPESCSDHEGVLRAGPGVKARWRTRRQRCEDDGVETPSFSRSARL